MNSQNDSDKRDNQKLETERRLEHLEDLVERQTRTERHLEQYADAEFTDPKNIEQAQKVQQRRQEEVDHLENIIVSGAHSNNDQAKNLEKRYHYTEGYLEHNADHMDKQELKNAEERQEHRKDQMKFL